jgi:hypothetical protein
VTVNTHIFFLAKQELPVAAMFDNGSNRNEKSLEDLPKLDASAVFLPSLLSISTKS